MVSSFSTHRLTPLWGLIESQDSTFDPAQAVQEIGTAYEGVQMKQQEQALGGYSNRSIAEDSETLRA